MTLDLSYNSEQTALQRSIGGLCGRLGLGPRYVPTHEMPAGYWDGLAELGVLGLGTHDGGGGPVDIAAAMETLGSFAAPGPLVGTFHAGALLDDASMRGVASGQHFVSVGTGTTYPWAPVATHVVEIRGDDAWLVAPDGLSAVSTTAREQWGTGSPRELEHLGNACRANGVAEIATAAYLVGAAQQLIDEAATYTRDRHQFGKPIATFQAVSHPLAQLSVRVAASRVLCRSAAQRLDDAPEHDDDSAVRSAAVARVSAYESAIDTAYAVHQVYGAVGFTREGPVAAYSHQIRQVGCLPPSLRSSRARVIQHIGITNGNDLDVYDVNDIDINDIDINDRSTS